MIQVNVPTIYGEEIELVLESLKSGWVSSESPYLLEFEKQMAIFSNRKHAIAVANGTAALEIAAQVIGIKPGDEIIMPSFTIISCPQSVTKLGAKPVLIDSLHDTWNMDTAQIENRITVKTKAIMVVHMYGLTTNMDEIERIAKKYKIQIIEDASEAIGQSWKNKPCGSFGNISTYSFYANKHISTGEGGMILTNDDDFAEKSRYYRNLCFNKERRFKHDDIGWNYRMTGMQAAFGLGQLRNIKKTIKRKKEIGKIYNSIIPDSDRYSKPLLKNLGSENHYWVYGIVLNPNKSINASSIMMKLESKGIGSRPFFYPIHLQPVYKKLGMFEFESHPNSENLSEFGFYLPSGTGNTNDEIIKSAETFLEIINS